MLNQILLVAETVFIKLAQGNSRRARLRFGEASAALDPDRLGSALHPEQLSPLYHGPQLQGHCLLVTHLSYS